MQTGVFTKPVVHGIPLTRNIIVCSERGNLTVEKVKT